MVAQGPCRETEDFFTFLAGVKSSSPSVKVTRKDRSLGADSEAGGKSEPPEPQVRLKAGVEEEGAILFCWLQDSSVGTASWEVWPRAEDSG